MSNDRLLELRSVCANEDARRFEVESELALLIQQIREGSPNVGNEFDDTDLNLGLGYPGSEFGIERRLLFSVLHFGSKTNGNWRSRCGCDSVGGTCSTRSGGKSYFSAINRNSKYDIRVVLVHGRQPNWFPDPSVNYKYMWDISKGGGNFGRYITNFYDSASFTLYGTLGYIVYENGKVMQRANHLPNFQNAGEEWWHCGKDFVLELGDSAD